jgi:hypothetical protein
MEPGAARTSGQANALIVDDEESRGNRAIVFKNGNVLTADNGAAAIQLARTAGRYSCAGVRMQIHVRIEVLNALKTLIPPRK